SPGLPARTVIKADLEFVSHHWRDPSYDLWEEEKGDHFYTRLVQRRALLDGANLADSLGDGTAAHWYRAQASFLEPEIARHWDANRGSIAATLNHMGGHNEKASGLDSAIVLAVLHASPQDGEPDPFFSAIDDRVLETASRITRVFQRIYAVNSRERDW